MHNMERLQKLVDILKLTPHKQPELVKEATHRILARPARLDSQIGYLLKPVIEILIQYCDNDDSAQRSLFNDYLNNVILTYQYQNYHLILHVLVEEISNNGSARSITTALLRIPHILRNVQPIDLGCEPSKLLKALIEVSRRSDDESVQKALDAALEHVMPYLDYHVRKKKDIQFFANSLVEVIFQSLRSDSYQAKRVSASCLAKISSASALMHEHILVKLKCQLDAMQSAGEDLKIDPNEFVGFCQCIKEIAGFAATHTESITKLVLRQIKLCTNDATVIVAALEILRDHLLNLRISQKVIKDCIKIIVDEFLLTLVERQPTLRTDVKVILQSNALSCFAILVKLQPDILDSHEKIFSLKTHADLAIRNQLTAIIGNYISASWSFPRCVDRTNDCERTRKLWVELRSILNDDSSHPDTQKSCVMAISTCINVLMESDHCLHILEYQDFDRLIRLYLKSNYKPFKTEVLNLFSKLNYRTLHYLESQHWSKLRGHAACSFSSSLQERILNSIIIASITDEHLRTRRAATSALVSVIPRLYIHPNGRSRGKSRPDDPIVSLSKDLADEHFIVLKQSDGSVGNHKETRESSLNTEADRHGRDGCQPLSSSIIPGLEVNPNIRVGHCLNEDISINLAHIVSLLKALLENSFNQGKVAISSIVRTLLELSNSYPIHQFPIPWDCRPSEYCDCVTVLNFLLTYLSNLAEPDVVVDDLDSYKTFLGFTQHLVSSLCHECVSSDYEYQRMQPFNKQAAVSKIGDWSNLTIKNASINDILQAYLAHLTKLLMLLTSVIEEKSNPFPTNSKLMLGTPQKSTNTPDTVGNHGDLTTNRLLFHRVFRKLEASYKSGKKNLNQKDEKFYQILEICLDNISSSLEYIGMNRSMEIVGEILGYLKVTSAVNSISSIRCAVQLLKSLFGINLLTIYQVDPHDWFEDKTVSSSQMSFSQSSENNCEALQGVYHHLISHPYRIFSNYHSISSSQITPASDKTLAVLSFETRRSLRIRLRIEERVRSLFEIDPKLMAPPRLQMISETLKNVIAEFTPLVIESMNQFTSKGFPYYQSEVLQFMSYLLLLRVNYQKLPLAQDLVISINKLLDDCGEKMFLSRPNGVKSFLRVSFSFLLLLTYERGPSKSMFQVATVIEKFDNIRAKLSMESASEDDMSLYVVPLLRCLVEDLFIYRTKQFQDFPSTKSEQSPSDTSESIDTNPNPDAKSDIFEALEAERDTVAQKLLDAIDNPKVYDLLSILILESRRNSSEIKYKKLSQNLISIFPKILSNHQINLSDYPTVDLTRKIIENISPEVFHPIKFIEETLLQASMPTTNPQSISDPDLQEKFQRWMSLVMISIHVMTTQVKEEKFLSNIRENMNDEAFVEYLLHIAQLCISEILIRLSSNLDAPTGRVTFLMQQLSSYIIYLSLMFQSGLFFQLSKTAASLVKKHLKSGSKLPKNFQKLCLWARDPRNNFCLDACEMMFYHVRLVYPDLTIIWCNVMMLLNNVDCNRDFWRHLLVYECHHCKTSKDLNNAMKTLNLNNDDVDAEKSDPNSNIDQAPKDSGHINRPSSLNLSDISFKDQLRRSFIKRIATTESRDKTLNRNIIETTNADGQLLEHVVFLGNTEQCLAPNIELSRRGALCLVLDFVSISMNDVEHITWLIIHHINDIIRWSHEMPIAEFINSIHGNSASSGIYMQAIMSNFNNLTSISFVTRMLWTLEHVHYTQYGSLVILLVEKLLTCDNLKPYRSLTRRIEEFACKTVQKLLNETNKSLVTTNDEVINQLKTEDLDRILGMLEPSLYERLIKKLTELRRMVNFPLVTFDILARDPALLENYCDKLLKLGWVSRRQFEEAWMTLLGVLSTLLSPQSNQETDESAMEAQEFDARANLSSSCKVITTLTKFLALNDKTCIGDPSAPDKNPNNSFDQRVTDLTKTIRDNLPSLRPRTQDIFARIVHDQHKLYGIYPLKTSPAASNNLVDGAYCQYLRISAQKLRISSILNIELDMQDTVVIGDDMNESSTKSNEIDIESCIRLILSIYKQKLKDPNESLISNQRKDELKSDQEATPSPKNLRNSVSRQLPPPLTTSISQSILALSDMFSDYEQFEWMFETFVQLLRAAERNEDEIQMQYLIIGLCKAATVCCYEIPNETASNIVNNHRDAMFEKCKQSIDRCLRSKFLPLKLNSLYGAYYMLEDSINIVASGAWELDDFRRLRMSRSYWIERLMPIVLDPEHTKLLTNQADTVKMLESLQITLCPSSS